MTAITAMCIPKNGHSAEFQVPMIGANIKNLAIMAKRARELQEGLKTLRAAHVLTKDVQVGRLAITSGEGEQLFGFDYQDAFYECSSSTSPSVTLQDRHRERGLRIMLPPASLPALERGPEIAKCSECASTLTQSEKADGDFVCHPCTLDGR